MKKIPESKLIEKLTSIVIEKINRKNRKALQESTGASKRYEIRDGSGVKFYSDGTISYSKGVGNFSFNINKRYERLTNKRGVTYLLYRNDISNNGNFGIVDNGSRLNTICDRRGNAYVELKGVFILKDKNGRPCGIRKGPGNSNIPEENSDVIFMLSSGKCYRNVNGKNIFYDNWSEAKKNSEDSKNSGPSYKLVKINNAAWGAKDVYYSPHNTVGDAYGLGNAYALKHIPSGSIYYGNGKSRINDGAIVSSKQWSSSGFIIEDNGIKYGRSKIQYPIRRQNGTFWNETSETIGVIVGIASSVTKGKEMSWDEKAGSIAKNEPPTPQNHRPAVAANDEALKNNPPTLKQIYLEIAKLPKTNKGWAVEAKNAGWSLFKINLYRSIINKSKHKNASNSVNKSIGFTQNAQYTEKDKTL